MLILAVVIVVVIQPN